MRTTPSLTFVTSDKQLYSNGNSRTISSLNASSMSSQSLAFNIGGSGWSAGQSLHFNNIDQTNGFCQVSAEL